MVRQNDHIRAEELISPYLDNRVTAEDKTFFERHVAGCADCHAKLESTRAMITALHAMPAMKAPRSFVLPREMARQPRPSIFRWYPALRLATVAAAVAFAIVFAGDLLTNGLGATPMALPAAAPALRSNASIIHVAPTSSATQVAPAAPTQAPAQPTMPPQATAAPAAAPTRPPQAAESAPAAAGAAAGTMVTATATITEPRAPALEKAPEGTSIAAAAPEATRTPAAKPAADQAPPAAEQPKAATVTAPVIPAINPLRMIEIALLGLVIVLGVVTLLIRKRTA